ncbi:hypothetical protein RFI_38124 [Reticulomyxa filosa]|uniref:Uncharacterized protein n=1 Tax=Reticulomyxa filosa TaxID=46433 RepID=X6LF74_RETFI|nr:hypothetical protein RFI_38124 [Reticulomyxa filosa]|eukprot:ETN99359.1 hypothetical protein RFI_38124 [Reticulomyxa filosa]
MFAVCFGSIVHMLGMFAQSSKFAVNVINSLTHVVTSAKNTRSSMADMHRIAFLFIVVAALPTPDFLQTTLARHVIGISCALPLPTKLYIRLCESGICKVLRVRPSSVIGSDERNLIGRDDDDGGWSFRNGDGDEHAKEIDAMRIKQQYLW